MESITLEQLQIEVGEWSARNFPNAKPYQPLLGMMEEFGELENAETESDTADAIADALIYTADYCARNNLKLSIQHLNEADLGALGKLAHYHLKGEQGIRYQPDLIPVLKSKQVALVVGTLERMAIDEGVNLMIATTKTWETVKKRDWIKNPMNAAAVAEQTQEVKRADG